MTALPKQEQPETNGFPVVDGSLQIGGMPLSRLAARVGRTPFYAYDRNLIDRQIALLRQHLPAQVGVSYAVKANPMPALVCHMAGLVEGFDVASAGELKTVLDSAMPAERISFAGPGKTQDELRQAVAAGITVNIESESELAGLEEAGRALGLRPRVAVRVNPSFELRGARLRMGGQARQFGIDSERVPALFKAIGKADIEFRGLHIFTGTQNLNAETITEAQTKTIEHAIELAADAPGPIRLLNMGGGFGIPYFPQDQPLDIAAVGRGLAAVMPRAQAALPEARLIVELGRYLVGGAGIYVCRVLDRKISKDEVFLVTDGGLHHHLAASGNFGQTIRRNFPVAIGNRLGDGAPEEVVSVVGCLCTPLDLLADKVSLPAAEIGDLVVVFQSGAYGLTASPAAFLSHPAAAEVLV